MLHIIIDMRTLIHTFIVEQILYLQQPQMQYKYITVKIAVFF